MGLREQTPVLFELEREERREGDRVITRTYTRFEDGSACIVGNDAATIYEQHPLAWQKALTALEQQGFRVVADSST